MRLRTSFALSISLALVAPNALAQTPLAWREGPAKIALPFDCTLDLASDARYLDVPQSKKLYETRGEPLDEHTLGVVGPKTEEPWQAILAYDSRGYIDDKGKLDAAALLTMARAAQDVSNKHLLESGHEPRTLLGWAEPPRYDAARHHVVWGMRLQSPSDTAPTSDYNTRILGRKGFVSVDVVTPTTDASARKRRATDLLGRITFNPGARYEDYVAGDKVAEMGLAKLVLGSTGPRTLASDAKGAGVYGMFAKAALVVVAVGALLFALKRFLPQEKRTPPAPPKPLGEEEPSEKVYELPSDDD